MTTRRDYSCNLCRRSIVEGSGVGLLWESKGIRLTTPGQAENHVCQTCLNDLEAALNDLRKTDKVLSDIAMEICDEDSYA